jgi:acetyl esterase/lipase
MEVELTVVQHAFHNCAEQNALVRSGSKRRSFVAGWTIMLSLTVTPLMIAGLPMALGAPPPMQYGPLVEENAEICQPQIDLGPRPAVLMIHGGGWLGGDKAGLSQRCHALAMRGYTVVNINYRLVNGQPDHSWPAALDDARQALSWIRANADKLQVDVARVGVMGDSVGGELALFLGAGGPYKGVRCTVVESGPVDLLTAPSFTAKIDPMVFTAQPLEEAYRSASPVYTITHASAPTMVVHGRADDLVPFSQAEELMDVLRRQKVAAALLPYDGNHDFTGTSPAEHNRVLLAEDQYLRTCLSPDDGVGNQY